MSDFGERLKFLRKEKKLTQTELAKLLSTTQGTVGKWENGKLEPNIEKLIELSIELGTDMDYLLGKDTLKSYRLSFNDFEEFSNKKAKKTKLFEERRDNLLNKFKRDYSNLIWDMFSLEEKDIVTASELDNLYKNTIKTFTDNLCMCGEEYNYFEFEILQRFYNKKHFDKYIKFERSIDKNSTDNN